MQELEYALPEIKSITALVANQFSSEKIFCLEGEMGAGKTTFIKSICEQWQVLDHVSSPTYSIINKYLCMNDTYIYHLDLFRLKNIDELIDLGFEDLLDQPCKLLIEWPELSYPLLKEDKYLRLSFEKISENTRKISIFT